jgi:cell division inhibitor SulA/protein ImuA
VPTGFPGLDSLLPFGGWPCGAVTEILPAREGMGELGLVMPVLARSTGEGLWVVWVAPPYLPYAPALHAAGVVLSRTLLVRPSPECSVREGLWAAEQALASGVCGAVLTWVQSCGDRELRRLQLAAERNASLAFLFRPAEEAVKPSPAALRLRLTPAPGGMTVDVVKCRGGWPRKGFLSMFRR